MNSEEFLQEQRVRKAKMHKRTKIICIVVCIVWIPIALWIYRPSFLFGDDQSSASESRTVEEFSRNI